MKLLVFTQKVDRDDPVLGFFHVWIVELSKQFESVEVVCLEKRIFNFPPNVTVYSLGKERGVSRLGYVVNFYRYLFLIRGSYDRVFVHMNQEYVLLGGLYWKVFGYPVFLWRNHSKGSLLTKISVFFSKKVFCTSAGSFTARFKKTALMPIGIDTKIFKEISGVTKKKYSVCMWGRVSPVKKIESAIFAIEILVSKGVQVSLTIAGPVLEKDYKYGEKLKRVVHEKGLSSSIQFLGPIKYEKLPEFCNEYEVYVNLTDSGSFDKTIGEAVSCGLVPIVTNTSLKGILPDICITKSSPEDIARSIERLLDATERVKIQKDLENFVQSQSLDSLMKKLNIEMQ